jgi:hypothetical protein
MGVALGVVVLICNFSCSFGPPECRSWAKTFFRMPSKEQIAKFGSYDLETQYGIFICGNQGIHPPAIYLAEPFARGGEPAARFLQIKLSQAKDDPTIRDIVSVFVQMTRMGTYDVPGDSALMDLITVAVAGMKDDDWKRIAEGMVARIATYGKNEGSDRRM